MKSIILAAGYATRLYPLTKNFPKPLLEVKGKAILDRLLDDIDSIPEITGHIIVSNHKFINHFESWKVRVEKKYKNPLTILDDGSTENENRLGAVKDIAFALEQCAINEDLLVLAGDNLLNFSLKNFVAFQKEKKTACVMRHEEKSVEKLRKTGVLTIDESDRVLQMQEKPVQPQSKWACPPFYIYTKEDFSWILKAVNENLCNTDAPGDFLSWFCSVRKVHAWLMTGSRHDIGDLKSYEEANK